MNWECLICIILFYFNFVTIAFTSATCVTCFVGFSSSALPVLLSPMLPVCFFKGFAACVDDVNSFCLCRFRQCLVTWRHWRPAYSNRITTDEPTDDEKKLENGLTFPWGPSTGFRHQWALLQCHSQSPWHCVTKKIANWDLVIAAERAKNSFKRACWEASLVFCWMIATVVVSAGTLKSFHTFF